MKCSSIEVDRLILEGLGKTSAEFAAWAASLPADVKEKVFAVVKAPTPNSSTKEMSSDVKLRKSQSSDDITGWPLVLGALSIVVFLSSIVISYSFKIEQLIWFCIGGPVAVVLLIIGIGLHFYRSSSFAAALGVEEPRVANSYGGNFFLLQKTILFPMRFIQSFLYLGIFISINVLLSAVLNCIDLWLSDDHSVQVIEMRLSGAAAVVTAAAGIAWIAWQRSEGNWDSIWRSVRGFLAYHLPVILVSPLYENQRRLQIKTQAESVRETATKSPNVFLAVLLGLGLVLYLLSKVVYVSIGLAVVVDSLTTWAGLHPSTRLLFFIVVGPGSIAMITYNALKASEFARAEWIAGTIYIVFVIALVVLCASPPVSLM